MRRHTTASAIEIPGRTDELTMFQYLIFLLPPTNLKEFIVIGCTIK